jgi:hypothetical protein
MKSDYNNITFHKGLPQEEVLAEFINTPYHKLIILDDLNHQIVDNQNIELLLTRDSHHKSASVIILSQNVFKQGKHSRDQSLNTQYFILMKNLRDINQIHYLSRQLYPSNPKKLLEAYEDCLSHSKYPYLVVDLHPESNDMFRLKTGIFPEDICITYTDKAIQ